MKTRVKVIINGLIVISIATALFSAYQLSKSLLEYKKGSDTYNHLITQVQTSDMKKGKSKSKKEDEKIFQPTIDFDSLQGINPDIAAWLYCEDTPINYPVVKGKDNEYYLKHLFDGTPNSAGCLFIEARNRSGFSDENTIVYGHNMKNGSMFAGITKYANQKYYEKHPIMHFLTPEGNYTVELFAGHVANTNDDSWQMTFENKNEYGEWLNKVREKSDFKSNVQVTESDQVVTLSTCSYEFENARYVVLGKLTAN